MGVRIVVASWLVCSGVWLAQAGCGQREDMVSPVEVVQASLSVSAIPAPRFAPGRYCDPSPFGQWCFYNPRPSGDWWRALGGKDQEIWVSGSSTGALHFNGNHWSRVETGLTDAEAFAEFSSDDVWVVGQAPGPTRTLGTIAHFDGTAFTTSFQQIGEFLDIWGANADDVYAVGLGPTQHWDGGGWTAVPGVIGQSVSGSGPNDVWIANFDGLQHFDGSTWQEVPNFQGAYVIAVVALSPDNVWIAVAAGGGTDIDHFDGNVWTTSTSIGANRDVWGLGAGGPNDVWVVGDRFVPPLLNEVGLLVHYDGQTWTELAEAPALVSRMARIGSHDLAVGQAGEILQLRPAAPVPFRNLTEGPTVTLEGTWGSSPSDMWAVGAAGTVLQYDGHAVRLLDVDQVADLNAVWGTSRHDVWVVGAAGTVLHFHGLHPLSIPVGTTQDLFAVFTAAPGDVWIGGANSTLLHLHGGMVTPVSVPGLPPGSDIDVLHGLAVDDIWVGGHSSSGGFVSHWNGGAWSPAEFVTGGTPSASNRPVHRLWEVAPDDVWVITSLGVAQQWEYLHFDGATWAELFQEPSPDTWMFNGAEPNVADDSFAFGPDDVWSVGPLGAWRRRTPSP